MTWQSKKIEDRPIFFDIYPHVVWLLCLIKAYRYMRFNLRSQICVFQLAFILQVVIGAQFNARQSADVISNINLEPL